MRGALAAAALVLAASCAAPTPERGEEKTPSGCRPPWGSVLGGSGASAPDAALVRATPPCRSFPDREALEREAASLRATFVSRLGIDLERRARSAVVQRRLESTEHDVEVVRLEVLDGIYLPLNVYLPRNRDRAAPVVLSPVGCESSCWSPEAQALASNLASLGMLVVISEGFCRNGARAALPDSDPRVGYARELLGLRGDVALHLQELVSTLTWAIESHPFADPRRVGVAGYSYGGHMSILLALADPRVGSVSVPATYFGEPCDARPVAVSDIHVPEEEGPDFVWSAPLEIPVLARNARIVMLYPRFLHTTAGSRDPGAPLEVLEGAMRYAEEIYGLAGLRGRLLFRSDGGDHHYGRSRREDTYEWLAATLLGEPSSRRAERPFEERPAAELAVDLSGTRTFADELRAAAAAERGRRLPGGHPTAESASRARRAAVEIFGGGMATLTPEVVWNGEVEGGSARALRYRGAAWDVPAVEIEGRGPAGSGTLLYVPERGMGCEIDALKERARRFEKVVAVDYLGIGELASDRLMLHSIARALMHADQSLPRANIAMLRGVLRSLGDGPVEIEGAGWAASLYAGILGAIEPEQVRRVHVSGVPADELAWLGAGRKVPDLLLHPELFARLTATELVP